MANETRPRFKRGAGLSGKASASDGEVGLKKLGSSRIGWALCAFRRLKLREDKLTESCDRVRGRTLDLFISRYKWSYERCVSSSLWLQGGPSEGDFPKVVHVLRSAHCERHEHVEEQLNADMMWPGTYWLGQCNNEK